MKHGFDLPMCGTPRDARLIRELREFATDPANYDPVCTYGAIRVWHSFNAGVWGYWCSENPSAVAGKSCGGHDFAIVLGRYLVDAWASEIEGLPIPVVIDLATKSGVNLMAAWYGDPAKWMNTREASIIGAVRRFNGFTPKLLSPAPPLPGRAAKGKVTP